MSSYYHHFKKTIIEKNLGEKKEKKSLFPWELKKRHEKLLPPLHKDDRRKNLISGKY